MLAVVGSEIGWGEEKKRKYFSFSLFHVTPPTTQR
jgi:hypothetical protein